MLGRAAYRKPWRLRSVDPELFGGAAPYASMTDVLEAMMPYIEAQLSQGTRLHSMTRHFVGAFPGVPGAAFRRHLAENGVKPGIGVSVLRDAVALVGSRAVASIAA
jgi:tRNA-dihydrouridine synthase A